MGASAFGWSRSRWSFDGCCSRGVPGPAPAGGILFLCRAREKVSKKRGARHLAIALGPRARRATCHTAAAHENSSLGGPRCPLRPESSARALGQRGEVLRRRACERAAGSICLCGARSPAGRVAQALRPNQLAPLSLRPFFLARQKERMSPAGARPGLLANKHATDFESPTSAETPYTPTRRSRCKAPRSDRRSTARRRRCPARRAAPTTFPQSTSAAPAD
jgi:hypothetical protein